MITTHAASIQGEGAGIGLPTAPILASRGVLAVDSDHVGGKLAEHKAQMFDKTTRVLAGLNSNALPRRYGKLGSELKTRTISANLQTT